MYRKILLAYDGTRESRVVLREGADLAVACGAETVLLAVADLGQGMILAEAVAVDGLPEAEKEQAEAILHEGIERLRARGIKATPRLCFGDPEREILAAAVELGVDLIVISHRRRGGWAQWRRGDMGRRLLKDAPCSVLVALEKPTTAP